MIGILTKVFLFYILFFSNNAIFSNGKISSLYGSNVRQLAVAESYNNSYIIETYANVVHDSTDYYKEDADDTLFQVGLKVTFLLLPIFIGIAAFKNIKVDKDKKGKD